MHKYTMSTSAERSLTAATAKTILAWINGSTRRCKMLRFELGFSSTTNTDAAVTYEIVRYSADGTGTAVTPVALDPANPAAIGTAKENYTVEPAGGTTAAPSGKITPQPGGTLVIPFDLSNEPVAAISTLIGIRLTSPTNQSGVRCTMYVEE